MAQAHDLVGGRLQVDIRDEDDVDLVTQLDGAHVVALFVEQEGGHIDRDLHVHGAGVLLHCLLLEDAQDVQGRRFGAADVPGAGAARAGDVAHLGQGGTQALAGQFQQAEAGDLAHLHPGAVEMQGIPQAVFHLALAALVLHVDEVDDDETAQVAQAQLAGDLVGRLHVGAQGRLLDVGAAGGAAGVHVHRHQRLGVVHDDGAARRQGDLAAEGGLDLVLDLEAGEQRHVVPVALHAIDGGGHDVRHELLGLLVDVVRVDQDLADVRLEVVADGADDQAALLVDEEGALLAAGGALDGAPELHQVVEVPLQFLDAAADTGGAGNQAHAGGDFQLVHGIAQFGAIVALDAAGDAAAPRVVGHQDQVAAGQRNEGGEGGTLGAALVLVHLDDEFLAFPQRLLDGGLGRFDPFPEKGPGDFLERQKAVALGAVIDEGRFEAGLDAGDDGLVDVALALLFCGRFDVEVYEFLAIDNGDTEFLGLCRVEQHALHFLFSRAQPRAGQTASGSGGSD